MILTGGNWDQVHVSHNWSFGKATAFGLTVIPTLNHEVGLRLWWQSVASTIPTSKNKRGGTSSEDAES